MAMPLSWFRVFIGAPLHMKLRRLSRELGNECAGTHWALRLWNAAATYAPEDGVLERKFRPAELEEELGWTGAPGVLVTALLKVGLLDRPLCVHQWSDHQPGIQPFARRSSGSRRRQRDEPPAGGYPAEFEKYWDLLPDDGGWRTAKPRSYTAWLAQELNGEAAAATRDEIYRALHSQRANDGWLFKHKNSNGRTYLSARLWEGYFRRPRTTDVPLLDPPQRADERDLKKEAEEVRADYKTHFPGREWPGDERAKEELTSMFARAAKDRN
jgi:hypothetical protein